MRVYRLPSVVVRALVVPSRESNALSSSGAERCHWLGIEGFFSDWDTLLNFKEPLVSNFAKECDISTASLSRLLATVSKYQRILQHEIM